MGQLLQVKVSDCYLFGKLKTHNLNLNVNATPVVSIPTQSEKTTTSQSKTSKSGPKWKPAEVHLLISYYRRFKHRFYKKKRDGKENLGEVIWLFYFLPVFCRFLTLFLSTKLAELMKSNGVTVTGERCSVKWKSMKER